MREHLCDCEETVGKNIKFADVLFFSLRYECSNGAQLNHKQ